jgi:hypothetical protein
MIGKKDYDDNLTCDNCNCLTCYDDAIHESHYNYYFCSDDCEDEFFKGSFMAK